MLVFQQLVLFQQLENPLQTAHIKANSAWLMEKNKMTDDWSIVIPPK